MSHIKQFPHCDQTILHKKGDCKYCDAHPEWQELRIAWGINFTGEKDETKLPCPSEIRRPAYVAHRWPGNRPTEVKVPLQPPSRFDQMMADEDGNDD